MAYKKSSAILAVALATVTLASCAKRPTTAPISTEVNTPPTTTVTTSFSLSQSSDTESQTSSEPESTPLPETTEELTTSETTTTTTTATTTTTTTAPITTTTAPTTSAPVTTPTPAVTTAPVSVTPISPAQTYYVIATTANVRTQPNTTATISSTLKYGATVQIKGKTSDGKWLQTSAGHFISAPLLSAEKPAAATTKTPAQTTAGKTGVYTYNGTYRVVADYFYAIDDGRAYPRITSADQIDTHEAPNIGKEAAFRKFGESAQFYVDEAIKQHGKDVLIRHKEGDGFKDPTVVIKTSDGQRAVLDFDSRTVVVGSATFA